MTENEKRILDVLSREGSLSKRDITARCAMGWATAVKMVARLEEQGFIRPEGVERRKSSGVSPAVYGLSRTKPVALGIDVEYGRVHASIRNLRGETLEDLRIPSPGFAAPEDLIGFLADLAVEFRDKAGKGGMSLEGIGVGVPNQLFGDRGLPYERISSELAARLGLPVKIDNNIRCFAQAVARFEASGASQLVLTIRSGIGAGIVIDGKVYQGEHGRAGEIGHILVDPAGKPCRCGKRGCLETIVNRDVLAEQAALALGPGLVGGTSLCPGLVGAEGSGPSGPATILPALFSEARKGEPRALAIIGAAAERLGKALAASLLVMGIGSVHLYAAFGPDGGVMLPMLEKTILAEVYPGLAFSLSYRELDEDTYVTGAAYLILREFVAS